MRWSAAACLLGACLSAGCGSDGEPQARSDREQVEAAATGYLEALADGEGDEACRHVAAGAQRDLATIAETSSCADAVEKLHEALDDGQREKLRDTGVSRTRIDGSRAEVTIAGGDTIPFEKVDGRWKAVAFASGGGYRTRPEGECIVGGMDEFDAGGGHAFWRREGRADFRDFIVELCRRADRQGLLSEGREPDQREIERIAGRVILEMAERGQIRDPSD